MRKADIFYQWKYFEFLKMDARRLSIENVALLKMKKMGKDKKQGLFCLVTFY